MHEKPGEIDKVEGVDDVSQRFTRLFFRHIVATEDVVNIIQRGGESAYCASIDVCLLHKAERFLVKR